MEEGIDSISLDPDAVVRTTLQLLETEQAAGRDRAHPVPRGEPEEHAAAGLAPA